MPAQSGAHPRYLLLDAGGTLVWPHAQMLIRAAALHGCRLDEPSLLHGYYRSIYKLDLALRGGGEVIDFFSSLLIEAGAPAALASAIVAELPRLPPREDGQPWPRSLWTWPLPWSSRALEKLHAAGHRMSVISNSDGTVASQLEQLGLARHFEQIFDSGALGVEKPDPRIFQIALERLGLAPGQCLYIGDVYRIDVLGANAAGIAAVHLDPLGLYADWPGNHTRDLESFAAELAQGRFD